MDVEDDGTFKKTKLVRKVCEDAPHDHIRFREALGASSRKTQVQKSTGDTCSQYKPIRMQEQHDKTRTHTITCRTCIRQCFQEDERCSPFAGIRAPRYSRCDVCESSSAVRTTATWRMRRWARRPPHTLTYRDMSWNALTCPYIATILIMYARTRLRACIHVHIRYTGAYSTYVSVTPAYTCIRFYASTNLEYPLMLIHTLAYQDTTQT